MKQGRVAHLPTSVGNLSGPPIQKVTEKKATPAMKMKNALTMSENRDFLRLYHRGVSQVSPLLVTYARKSGKKDRRRIGITATKKVGGAVQRNRAKRLIRAAWREVEPNVPYGWDFVFVARGKTTGARMQQVRTVMADHLRRLTDRRPSLKKNEQKK